MNKKKLLVTTSTFPRWKDDTDPPFVFELAKRLTGAFDITVLTPNYPGALTDETIENIKVHRFRYFINKLEILAGSEGILPTLKRNKLFYLIVPLFFLAEFWALLKLIKKTRPHVVHAHWILPQGVVAALANKLTGVPFVMTIHGGDIYGLQGGLPSFLKSYALKKAARVTVVSKDIQKTIKEKYGKDIHTEVIPMGVDSDLFHPGKYDLQIRNQYDIRGPFLLYVGRLTEKKGVHFLIKAMPEIVKHEPDTKLLVIGNGEEKQNLEELTQKIGLSDSIIFAGSLPNFELPAYFASADIFIGPSIKTEGGDTEGFGLTFVETGMSGCIVIGTDVGGISDIIEDGKTGYLVREKDPSDIADTVSNILKQPDTLSDIRIAARQKMISKFDWQVIADKYQKTLSL